MRLFDFSYDTLSPVKTFEGHTGKIYNAIFSTALQNIVATGSDDRTIRIWRTVGEATPMAVCGGVNVKNSHS